MTRSFIPGTVAFAAGIALAQPLPLPDLTPWLFITAAGGGVLLAHRLSRPLLAAGLLLPFFFLLGSLHGTGYLEPPADPRHIANLIKKNQELCLTATLIEKPLRRDGRQKLTLEVDHALAPGDDLMQPAWGRVLLTLPAPSPSLTPGTRYIVRTKLSPVKNFRTPGAFDQKGHLAAQGVWVTGWIKHPLLIREAHEISPPSLLLRVEVLPELVRARIERFMHDTLDHEVLGLYKALLIGDRSSLEPELLDAYKESGAFHLVAISGSHLALLAFLCNLFYGSLLRRSTRLMLAVDTRKIVLLLSGLTILAYSALAGFEPPVMRSLIMLSVFFLAVLLDRQWCSFNNLAIAALVILSFEPSAIRTASFQLTFAAATAIVLAFRNPEVLAGAGRKATLSGRIAGWIKTGLVISIAATLATAPLLLYHFNQASLLSPISTPVIAPFLCFLALPAGLLAIPFTGPLPEVAALLFKTGAWGIHGANRLAAFFAGLPFASVHLPTPFPLEVAACYLLMAGLFFWKRGRIYKAAAAMALVTLALMQTALFFERQSAPPRVSILDVGKGSAVVLELAAGETILVDGGGPSSERFNVGEGLIAPFLWKNRISALTQIVISHPHADHYNGLPYLIEHFRPQKLWINGDTPDDPIYREILRAAREHGVQIRRPERGEVLYSSGGKALRCIRTSPPPEQKLPINAPGSLVNNRSLVLRLEVPGGSFLFPGDIEREVEAEMVQQDAARLRADVLLAPHHGRKSSGSEEFLAAVGHDCLVIAGGEEEAPASRPARGAGNPVPPRVFSTATDGTVRFTIRAAGLDISTYRQEAEK